MTAKKPKFHTLIDVLTSGFNALPFGSRKATTAQIVILASTIDQVMSARERYFHNLDHPLGMLKSKTPIEKLAILFHDLVYLQVDRRIHPLLAKHLEPFEYNESNTILIPQLKDSQSEISQISCIFGVKEGEELSSSNGANEFLSALSAWRMLEPFLEETEKGMRSIKDMGHYFEGL